MMDLFNRICNDIKDIKIQGAENIAKLALFAYSINPNKETIKKLISLRPTEPMLVNVLNYAGKHGVKETLKLIKENEAKIVKFGLKIIKNNLIIFTHCHSSTVVSILKAAKKQGKKFQVYNTETRPLYQGRKTALELAKANIKVTTIVDAAAHDAIKKSDFMVIGADAILKSAIINKIGSGLFAELAFNHKVPVYVASNSWKFSNKPVKIEERNFKEVWKNAPKHVKVKDPAFEIVRNKYIKAIISELGILKPSIFVKKVRLK